MNILFKRRLDIYERSILLIRIEIAKARLHSQNIRYEEENLFDFLNF